MTFVSTVSLRATFTKGLFASHAPTCSYLLQSIVLRNVYYRMERVGANRSMLRHYDANKPQAPIIDMETWDRWLRWWR